MKKFTCLFLIFFSLVSTNLMAKNLMILKLEYGRLVELYPDKHLITSKDFKNYLKWKVRWCSLS